MREIQRQLPGERIVYFGDTARYPYGQKSPETVTKFGRQDCAFLLEQDVKLIVAACNTVSAYALDTLKDEMQVPVIGVVEPGAVAAAKATHRKLVGVVGTDGTIASGAYQRALTALDPTISVFVQACPLFVPLAEEGWIDSAATLLIAQEYLEPIRESRVDVLVLGCTHYPLLKSVIRKVVGPEVTLTDSAEEAARKKSVVLDKIDGHSDGESNFGDRYYVSDVPLRFRDVAERFLGHRLPDVELVSVSGVNP